MRPVLLATAALLALTACQGDDDTNTGFFKDCRTFLSDPELVEELARVTTTPDAACTCLQAELEDSPDEERVIGAFFARVTEHMHSTGLGAEDAAGRLAAQSILPANADQDPRFDEALGVFNDVFEDLMVQVEADEGACPAV